MQYIDYATAYLPHDDDGLCQVMHKRLAFLHEREVRVVKILPPPPSGQDGPNGVEIDADVLSLCLTLRVSPTAPKYYFDAVQVIISALCPELCDRLRWSEMTAPPRRFPR